MAKQENKIKCTLYRLGYGPGETPKPMGEVTVEFKPDQGGKRRGTFTSPTQQGMGMNRWSGSQDQREKYFLQPDKANRVPVQLGDGGGISTAISGTNDFESEIADWEGVDLAPP